MTDTTTVEAPRNDAGQFESTEPAYGREGLERAAGYVPMQDDSKAEAPEELTKDEAAQRLRELSGPESKIITHTTGLPANETMTTEQAAEMLAEARQADASQAEIDDTKAQQKEVDKLRGEKPESKAQLPDGEIDVERALANPKIQAAITERVATADAQREAYSTAVDQAGKFAAASLFSEAPELASLPLDQWANTINALHQHDPARARVIFGKLQALGQVEAASQQLKTQKAAREQTEFRNYAAKENARFAEMTKSIPAKEMDAVKAHVPKMLAEHGADVAQFLKAVSSQSTFPRATAEALLVKAARYDLLSKAAKATPTRDIPHVQKPGIAGSSGSGSRNDASLAALSAKLSKSGSLKDAVALRLARSKGR
jgi:hypothetical protein